MRQFNEEEETNEPSTTEKKEPEFVSLMAEPPPSTTRVVEELTPVESRRISDGRLPLDRDIAFVMGEAEMPLTVYESPLMVSYRKFQEMKREDPSDGYYIVNRKQIVNRGENNEKERPQNKKKLNTLDQSIEQLFEDDHDDSDILLLYGRGPVFRMRDDYSDRYLGFDD